MTTSHPESTPYAISLPIPQAALREAQQFASEQPTPEKAAQVQLNTLAVATVESYLQLMNVPTDSRASDSWNPIVRLCTDTADLYIPEIGWLECRPVREQEQICQVPPDVWQDRVGYVVVRIHDSMQEASIIGFVQTVTQEEIAIATLHPPETMLDYLVPQTNAVADLVATLPAQVVHLSQWFQNLVATGWDSVDAILNPPGFAPAYAFRSPVERSEPASTSGAKQLAKRLTLAGPEGEQTLALVATIQPPLDQQMNIHLEVHPLSDRPYLPPGLHLTVLDESEAVFLEAIARNADNYMQLEFNGMVHEQFAVRITLGSSRMTQHFVI